MKILLFSLLVCVAGIYALSTVEKIECFDKSGINLTEYIEHNLTDEDTIIKSMTSYEVGCLVACFKKLEIVDGTTLVQYIQKSLLPSPDSSQLSEADRTKYTKIANDCIAEAKGDECEVMKCLKAWEKPFESILGLS